MSCVRASRSDAPIVRSEPLMVRYRSAIRGNQAELRQFLEVDMSFINSNGLDDLARRLADAVPE